MNDETLFHLALEKSPNERAAFLDAACAGDRALRQSVEALLAAHDNPGSFLANVSPDAQATVAPDPVPPGNVGVALTEGAGTRIGPYKLLQKLGEGGMGVVYLAEQERPVKRRVALKIIKAGMDSAQVIARFEQERQALAMMDHPNIARVLDAGTTATGRPYFVMELVKGIPMTAYCDQAHLTPTERLQLFIPVCHAVQHAHQKGVIHRDLKPSNVMIALYDGKPVPKVIDFGVAKATNQKLTERTMFTEVGSIVGTLEYMAPEQAELNNLDIDTRADVYSLGVLLYELLTGSPPFTSAQLRSAGFPEMLRMICEVEPPRPSTRLSSSKELPAIAASRKLEPRKLTQQVFGDLDWIVMKALEKDRGRRYETANGLAEDIARYLADDPVLAGPPSVAYRLRKFLKRNRGPVLAASVLLLALVFGIAGTTWGLVRAVIAEGDAIDARDRAIHKEMEAIDEKVRAAEARNDAEQERNNVTAANNQLKIVTDGLRRTLYASDLNLAQVAWEQNNVGRLRELVDGQRPQRTGGIDLRGFEWHYLHRLGHAELDTHTLKGDFDLPNFEFAFSPDGSRLATMGGRPDDIKIEVWDPATGKGQVVHRIVNRSVTPPYRCSFSGDARFLAASGHLGWLKVFDVHTGQELFSLPKSLGPIPALALSPDGKRVAAMISNENRPGFVQGGGKVWDVGTGKEVCSLPTHNHFWFSSLVYSPDGTQLAGIVASQDPAMNEMSVKVWDAATGKELFSLDKAPVLLLNVAFTPDGKRLAAVYHQGPYSRALLKPGDVDNLKGPTANGIKIWEVASGKEILKERFTFEGGLSHDGVGGLAFSPDGNRLAAGSTDKIVKIWDMATGNMRRVLKGHQEFVPAVAFRADGKHLYSVEVQTGTLKVWDAAPNDASLLVKGGQRVVFCPDGTQLATICDGMPPWSASTGPSEVTVWDLAGKKILSFTELTGQEMGLDFSSDGLRLVTLTGVPGPSPLPAGARENAAATRELKVRDVRTGNVLLSLRLYGSPTGVTDGLQGMVAFSPDGKRIVMESPRPKTLVADIQLIDAATGKIVLTVQGGFDTVSRLVFSRDGTRFAGATWPGPVKVWNADTGKELFDVALGDFPVFALSPDGRHFATRHENNVRIWDIDTRKELFTLKGHSQRVSCIAFCPRGKRIATATGMRAGYLGQGHDVKIWDAATGQQLLTLKGHAGDIRHLMFTPDGNRLYSAGIAGDTWGDFEIRVWDATPK